MSNLCDTAKALLNIDQTCKITQNLGALASSLPVQSQSLNEAVNTTRTALDTGPAALRDLNSTIMGASLGVRNTITAYERLATDPLAQSNALVGQYTQAVRNAATASIGIMDSIQCISNLLTGKAVPGISTAENCLNAGAKKLIDIGNKTSKLIADVNKATVGAVDEKLKSWNTDVNNALKEFASDHSVVACLASAVNIPTDTLTSFNSQLNALQTSNSDMKKGLGNCSGALRDSAKAFDDAKKSLDKAKADLQDLDDQLTTLKNQGLATLPEELKPLTSTIGPQLPAVYSLMDAAATGMTSTATTLKTAATQTDDTVSAFTHGHEITLDRIGNIIRIKHKDRHLTLYTSDNIIHAEDVQHKRLVWLENMMQKYNNHKHFYRPGSGPVVETTNPVIQLDSGDGTTVTLAG